jgi:hypothetical protein
MKDPTSSIVDEVSLLFQLHSTNHLSNNLAPALADIPFGAKSLKPLDALGQ